MKDWAWRGSLRVTWWPKGCRGSLSPAIRCLWVTRPVGKPGALCALPHVLSGADPALLLVGRKFWHPPSFFMVIVIWWYIHLFSYPALSSNSNSCFCTPMSLSKRAPKDKHSCPRSPSTASLLCRISSPLCSLSINLSLNSRVNSSFLRMCDPHMQYSRQGLVQTLCAGNDISFYCIWGKAVPSLGAFLITGAKRVAVLTSSQPPSVYHKLPALSPVSKHRTLHFLQHFIPFLLVLGEKKKKKLWFCSPLIRSPETVSVANEINKILAFWATKEMSLKKICPKTYLW